MTESHVHRSFSPSREKIQKVPFINSTNIYRAPTSRVSDIVLGNGDKGLTKVPALMDSHSRG